MQGGAPLFHGGSERTSVRENRKRSDNAADASPQPFSDGLLDLFDRERVGLGFLDSLARLFARVVALDANDVAGR